MPDKFFVTPFAQAGDVEVIPNALQPDGSVSFAEGFGPDYELAQDVMDTKEVPRTGFNALFHDLTVVAGQTQRHGYADWNADVGTLDGGYAQHAIVWYNGDTWQSQINANTTTPTSGSTTWLSSADYMVGLNILYGSAFIYFMGQI